GAVDRVVATGGTLGAVVRSAVLLAADELPPSLNGASIGVDDLERLADLVGRLSPAQRKRRLRLSSRRAVLLTAGVAVALAGLRAAGCDRLALCDWGLREGMLLEMLGEGGEGSSPRVAERSAEELAGRLGVDLGHARHVAALATELFDRTVMLHRLEPADRRLLEVAALCHDVGQAVAGDRHEQHGAYIVQNAGLRGLDPSSVAAVATLVRYHRRGTPGVDFGPFADLSAPRRQAVTTLVALLRMAEALDYGQRRAVAAVELRMDARKVVVAADPRPGADVTLELWSAAQCADLFEAVFGRRLDVVVAEAAPAIAAG
ncbi:MAG TPA: HD domain-containing protein, partial [Acidimicrobiales bacterium]|nr:HD domain-containing protein [Acidimicrobiales bacterium]